jgi:hypothetical protein
MVNIPFGEDSIKSGGVSTLSGRIKKVKIAERKRKAPVETKGSVYPPSWN